MIGVAVAVIKGARTEQRMTIHLVELYPNAQVVRRGNCAARTEANVRTVPDRSRRYWQALFQIDTQPIGVHAGIDEEFGPVFAHAAGLRFFVRGIVIAGVFVASV